MSRALAGLPLVMLLFLGGWTSPGGWPVLVADPYALGQFYQNVGPVIPYNSTHLVARIAPAAIVGSKKVIVIIGDSVAANSVPTLYTVTQAKNYNFNIADGAIYQGSDPTLGASNGSVAPFLSSVAGPLGDNIITGGFATNAVIADNAMGSSVIANWAAGGALNQNIKVMAARLANLGLTPDAAIWHGGPNDTNLGTSQAAYTAGLNSMIATMRTYWPSVPILIGICTQASGTPSAAIQAAQAAAVNHPAGIWAGVNSDAYAGADFQDGTHFAVAGRTQWATDATALLHAAGAF